MTDAFTELTAAMDYPMFVVTAAAAGEQSGCLVGFATQCSIDPPGSWCACPAETTPAGWRPRPT